MYHPLVSKQPNVKKKEEQSEPKKLEQARPTISKVEQLPTS